jgi:hypothetical protein
MVSPPLWFKDYLQVLCYYIVISILSFVELRIMVPFEDLTLPFVEPSPPNLVGSLIQVFDTQTNFKSL